MPELIFNLANPRELQGYVRGIQMEEEANPFSLSEILPAFNLADTEFTIVRGNLQDQPMALFRTFDAESPIAPRVGGTKIHGSIPPISIKVPLGEESRLRLNSLRLGGDQADVVRAIYDDARNLTRQILARAEALRGEALYTGAIAINENGLQHTVTFGRHADMSVAPGTLWSDLTNSDPIQDLVTWQEAYRIHNGRRPGRIRTSARVWGFIIRNAKVRVLAASQSGAPALVADTQANQVLNAFGLPPVELYDSTVRVNATTTQRVIPDDRLLLLPPAGEPLGNTFYGITAEALELVDSRFLTAQEAPGIVSVVSKEYDPPKRWTKVAALTLPVLANPDLAMVADVA